jgi:hypothetical protein
MSGPVTVLYAHGAARVDDALAEGGDLWLRLDDLTRASGWALKPEGACLGDVCVPLPAAPRNRYVRGHGPDARFNLPELARLLDMPVIADTTTRTWCFGESAPARGGQLDSLKAPDFTLPDLDGRMHALSGYRGKKVFLVAWASW